jgi:cellulose synthase/poly-beta-1,6-N-acetylglucosamine synthase-like glycosyltransferase/tetratricopeptide (TPR) repeat protein
MSDEKQQETLPELPKEVATPPRTNSDDAVRRAESSLAQAESLVNEVLDGEGDLSNTSWRLTLARWTLGQRDSLDRQWPRQTAIVVAAAATSIYLFYRLFWTMNLASLPAAVFSTALLAAECYAGASLGLYFYQVWRLVEPPLRRPTTGRTVDVFVATYNEDVALLRGTLAACVAMDYPHTTCVLDDGAREEVRQLAESLGVRYLSRTERTHAKAGNLNNALRQTNGEFIVVLDADHLPYRHYITRLIGYFDDPAIGFVQAPHTTYNLDNFMGHWKRSTKAYWEDVRVFFEAVQLGKNRHGVACFCGSAAIFRRKAIDDVGGFATETITEDLHTGMRIHAAGWKSLAVGEEMVVGLAPDDAATFASQRLRWGEGNLSVFAYDNPLTMKGLTLAGRINYFASIASWTFGPARLILYLTPLVMLLSGVAPVSDMSVRYVAVVGCYLLSVWTAVKVASNGAGQLLGIELAMMASFHLQIQALWRALFRRRRQKFVVTRKNGNGKRSGLRQMWPQAALVAVSIVAVSWAAARVAFGLSADYFCLAIGGGLAAYHAWLALTVLGRSSRRRHTVEQWRHPLCLAADCVTRDAVTTAVSIELNENGCRLLTWEPLDELSSLEIALHSPVGTTICHGMIAQSTPLGGRKPFAYLSDIVFANIDPVERERESDSLRGMILRYVVPVVTMSHRLERQGGRALPETLSGEDDLPMPVSIDTHLPNTTAPKAIALSIDRRGFLAALDMPCPVGSSVRVVMDSPLGPVFADAEVDEVETMRVGASIIYQHEFHWRDTSSIRQIVSRKRRWQASLQRSLWHLRHRRRPLAQRAALQLGACLLAGFTVFAFGRIHSGDIVLAAAASRPGTLVNRSSVESELGRMTDLASASTDRLLRVYEAAASVGDHLRAAEAAKLLADRIPGGRLNWTLTSARHLARTGDHRAADAAFDRLLSEKLDRQAPLEKQAEIYVEAARAAVAVHDLQKAVDRFLMANNLRTTDPEQAEELLGALIAAKQTKLAIAILEQLEPSDRVLRRIVDVYEMAKQPEAAVPQLEELYRRHPEDAKIVQRLAELAVARKDFIAGVKYYRALQTIEPDNETARGKLAETMLLRARVDVAAGRLDKALALFDESFKLESPGAKLKREYAGVLVQAGRPDEALVILESLTDAESRFELASVLEAKGEYRRARDILLEIQRVPAVSERAGRSIARLLLATRNYAEAARRLLDLLKGHPSDPRLQSELIDAAAASEHPDDAVRQAVLAIYRERQKDSFASLGAREFVRLADALRRLGLLEEADVFLKQGVARFPQSRRLRYYLADTLSSLGRYGDAETQYRTLLATQPRQR